MSVVSVFSYVTAYTPIYTYYNKNLKCYQARNTFWRVAMTGKKDERRTAFLEKTRFELESLAGRGVRMGGNAFSAALIVKGELSVDESQGAEPFSGRDGDALRKSLERLGYEPEDWCWALFPSGASALGPDLVRETIAALDPATLIVCDEAAAAAVREAYADSLAAIEDLNQAMLVPGVVSHLLGMRVLNLGGFDAALDDSHSKQLMWAYLKQIPPLGEPY